MFEWVLNVPLNSQSFICTFTESDVRCCILIPSALSHGEMTRVKKKPVISQLIIKLVGSANRKISWVPLPLCP